MAVMADLAVAAGVGRPFLLAGLVSLACLASGFHEVNANGRLERAVIC
jgi:hypothetical protein